MAEEYLDMTSEEIEDAYEDILNDLSTGHCVLLLGPELSVNAEGIGYKSYFKQLVNEKVRYYPEENLFFIKESSQKRRIRNKIRKFYRKVGDPVLLEMIARVRFPLIINVCPDKAINKVFHDHNIEITEGYLFEPIEKDNEKKDKKNYTPGADKPVIYNIFGSIEDPNTLIITRDKLYETIEKLLPGGTLPNGVEKYLNYARSFIFLGFSFDSWYYQLICHRLKIFRGEGENTSLSTSGVVVSNEIMRNHFQMVFTPENPTQAVERIINKCNKTNQELLRKNTTFDHLSLFVSYAWGNNQNEQRDRETIVNWLEDHLTPTVQFLRDKNEITYGDSINSFMTRIGQGKAVIRVVSDKYLKSQYCMTEALRIDKYNDKEKRIFTVVWDDIKTSAYYKKYWREKCNEIFTDIDKNLTDIIEREQYKKPHIINLDIYAFVDKFLVSVMDDVHLKVTAQDFVKDGRTTITTDRKKEFEDFITTVMNKMKQTK